MSDPCLVQINFRIKPEMPYDMKKLILALFTDYYETYYPDKSLSQEEYNKLRDKYETISNLCRNDAYHNIEFQTYKLDEYEVYDLDTLEVYEELGYFLDDNGNPIPNPTPSIGIGITSLPRRPETVEEFLELVGPYIYSTVSTIGICHYFDYGTTVAYYYIDKQGHIRKQMIEQKDNDEVLSTAISKKYSDEEDEDDLD